MANLKSIKASRTYPITYTKKMLRYFKSQRRIDLSVDVNEFNSFGGDARLGSETKSFLGIMGIDVHEVLGYTHMRMHEWHHTGLMHLHVYLLDDGQKKFRALQIMDICIKEKFRGLGIGTKVLKIMEEICRQNSIQYIFGILEAKGDLEQRKNFFRQNGFWLKEDRRFGMSNICAAKLVQ